MARPRSAPKAAVSARGQAAEALSESLTKEDWKQLIEDAKAATKSVAASCPDCGHKFPVVLRDVARQLDVFMAVLEQVEGKAGQALPEATQIVIERVAR